MRTEQEIKKELKNTEYQHIEITTKYYDAQKQGLITQMFLGKEVIKIEQKIEQLKWVLKDSQYKRTIYDLNKEELLELFYLAMPNIAGNKLTVDSITHLKNQRQICFYVLGTLNHKTFIHEELGITVYYKDQIQVIYGIANYLDAIRNMLTKEKPNGNQN